MKQTGWRRTIATLRGTPMLLLVQKVLRRVPFRPLDVGKLCFLRLEGVPGVTASQLRGVCLVRQGTSDDLERLVELQDRKAEFLERFAAGDKCVVAVDGERIVGYEWFCDRAVHQEAAWGLAIAIPEGFVYAYDAYIEPAHRNTGVWLRFKAYLADWMTATGKRGVLTFVEYGNSPSFRTHLRFGFIPSETVLAFKVIGLKMFKRLRAVQTMWLCLGFVPFRTLVHAVVAIRLR